MISHDGFELSIERLRAGRRIIVSDFSCELPRTGLVCIVGPNGAGKSMLIRALTGIDRRQRVSITAADGNVPEIAVAFDFAGLLPAHGLEDLFDSSSWFGGDEQAVRENLQRLGVDPTNSQPFAQWSLGSRQRARMGLVLASTRPIVVLDEPFRSIDHDHRFSLIDLLVEQASSQLILVSTHHAELLAGFTNATLQLRPDAEAMSIRRAKVGRELNHRVRMTGRGLTRFDHARSIESGEGVVHQDVVLGADEMSVFGADLVAPHVEIHSVVISDLDESS